MGEQILSLDVQVLCQTCSTPLRFAPSPRAMSSRLAGMLLEADVRCAAIVGCPQSGPGRLPCTGVASVLEGCSEVLKISGQAAMTSKLRVLTNGVPPQVATYRSEPRSIVAEDSIEHWLKGRLTDELGHPIPNVRYKVTLADGSIREGRTSRDGDFEYRGLKAGALANVEFPDLEEDT